LRCLSRNAKVSIQLALLLDHEVIVACEGPQEIRRFRHGLLVLTLEKRANLELRDIQSADLKQRGEPLSEERVGCIL
jgi:hypothetical protein